MTKRQDDDTAKVQQAPPARASDPQKPGEPSKPGPQEEGAGGTEVSGLPPTAGPGRDGAPAAGPDDRS